MWSKALLLILTGFVLAGYRCGDSLKDESDNLEDIDVPAASDAEIEGANARDEVQMIPDSGSLED